MHIKFQRGTESWLPSCFLNQAPLKLRAMDLYVQFTLSASHPTITWLHSNKTTPARDIGSITSHQVVENNHIIWPPMYQVGLIMTSMLYSHCPLLEHTCHDQTYTWLLCFVHVHVYIHMQAHGACEASLTFVHWTVSLQKVRFQKNIKQVSAG